MAKKDYSNLINNMGRGDASKKSVKPKEEPISIKEIDEDEPEYYDDLIALDNITENEDNTFKIADDTYQEELVNSIRLHGLMDPLIVVKDKNNKGKFILYSGHRRLKALKTLEKKNANAKVYYEMPDKSKEIAALCSYNLGYRGDDPFGMAMNCLKYNFEEAKKDESERISYKDATGISEGTSWRIEQLATLKYEMLKVGQDGYFTRDDALAFIKAKGNDKKQFSDIQEKVVEIYNSDIQEEEKKKKISNLVKLSGKKIKKSDELAARRDEALKLGRSLKKASEKISSVDVSALSPKAKNDFKKLVEESKEKIDAIFKEL